MAELLSKTALGGAINDTFEGMIITRVIADGVYVFNKDSFIDDQVVEIQEVADEAARLAETDLEVGDERKQTDTGEIWKLQALPAATATNWAKATGGGIDDVLAEAQALTADRTIEQVDHDIVIEGDLGGGLLTQDEIRIRNGRFTAAQYMYPEGSTNVTAAAATIPLVLNSWRNVNLNAGASGTHVIDASTTTLVNQNGAIDLEQQVAYIRLDNRSGSTQTLGFNGIKDSSDQTPSDITVPDGATRVLKFMFGGNEGDSDQFWLLVDDSGAKASEADIFTQMKTWTQSLGTTVLTEGLFGDTPMAVFTRPDNSTFSMRTLAARIPTTKEQHVRIKMQINGGDVSHVLRLTDAVNPTHASDVIIDDEGTVVLDNTFGGSIASPTLVSHVVTNDTVEVVLKYVASPLATTWGFLDSVGQAGMSDHTQYDASATPETAQILELDLNYAASASGEFVATKIDSNAGATVETLDATTNAGTVKLFTNIDVTNTATLAVAVGETLNGVTDGTFLFSNYEAGTQFRADEVTGGWVVSVVGASTQTDAEILLDAQSIASGGTLTLPADLSAYEYIRFEIEDAGAADVSLEGRCRADAISDCRVALHHDDASGYIYFDTNVAGTTATLTATVSFTGNMTARAIGVKTQAQSVLAGMVTPETLPKLSIENHAAAYNTSIESYSATSSTPYTAFAPATSTFSLWTDNAPTRNTGDFTITSNSITANKAGDYSVSVAATVENNGTDNTRHMQLLVDGAPVKATSEDEVGSSEAGEMNIKWAGQLNVGSVIDVRFASSTGDTSCNSISIDIDGLPTSTVVNPDALEVTDLHRFTLTKTTGQTTVPTTYPAQEILTWDTTSVDTGGGVSGNTYVIPVGSDGIWSFKAAAETDQSGTMDGNSTIQITVNGAEVSRSGFATAGDNVGGGSSNDINYGNVDVEVDVTAGDIVAAHVSMLQGIGITPTTTTTFFQGRQVSAKSVTYLNPAFTEAKDLSYFQSTTVTGSLNTTTPSLVVAGTTVGTGITNNGDGSFTLNEVGLYEFDANVVSNGGTSQAAYPFWADGVGGPQIGSRASAAHTAASPDATAGGGNAHAIVNGTVGQVIWLDTLQTATHGGLYITIKQLPSSTVVMPDALEVEDTSIEGTYGNEVAAVFDGYEFRMSQAEGQAQVRVTTGTKAISSFSAYHTNADEGTTASGFQVLTTSWEYLWSDNTLNMGNAGDYERFVWNDGTNSYEARLIVGTGFNNNFIEIKKLGQKSVINTTDLPVAGVGSWSDGDFGVWNAISGQFEPAVLSEVTGTNVTDTLNQLTGTTWSVNTSTSPGNLDFNWNSDFASYTQEGNKRYYTLRMYLDNDSEITFEVTGAQDVVSVQGIGNSLGGGDFANRMCFVKRESANVISINRDDDNDVDMFVDITFTAIM